MLLPMLKVFYFYINIIISSSSGSSGSSCSSGSGSSSGSSSCSSSTCHLYAGYYLQLCTYVTVDNVERLNLEF